MLKAFLSMYVTLMPIILAGVVNSIFCAKSCFSSLKKPIDFGVTLGDGERLFGDHKTWKGFLGYIVFSVLLSVIWGWASQGLGIDAEYDFFYAHYDNTLAFNVLIGALLGLFYGLFELPNSFLKRRFHIIPGKNPTGAKKIFFICLDQSDSLFGIVLVICLFYPMPVWFYFLYVFVGAVTHVALTMVLYALKFRNNKF